VPNIHQELKNVNRQSAKNHFLIKGQIFAICRIEFIQKNAYFYKRTMMFCWESALSL